MPNTHSTQATAPAPQCPHKNATSCRLSSIPNCCACADERQHSSSYRRYIDGVGFVQGGTRWQSYCPTCKEFWTNRIAATDPPIELSHTRIPEIPDQTEFIERWGEFDRGYRIATQPDGTEQRIAVLGEPLKDVSPGLLPRTLAQLRDGVVNNVMRPENRLRRRRQSLEESRQEEPQQSLDDMLDNLINEASDNEAPNAEEPPIPQIAELPANEPIEPPRSLTRREAQLQRARQRFVRIFGTREDIQQDDYESPLTTMYSRAYDRYRQAEERRAEGTTAAPALDGLSPQERRDIEEQLLWGVMRESQAMNESLEREGDVWSYTPARPTTESGDGDTSGYHPDTSTDEDTHSTRPMHFPITSEAVEDSMRMMALEYRYQQRRPATPPSTNAAPSTTLTSTSAALPTTNAATNTTLTLTSAATATASAATPAPRSPAALADVRTSIEQITSELQRLRLASEALSSARHSMHARFHHEPPTMTLDSQPDRPPPMTDAQMTKTLACQVCYQQLADIACLPCGHMVMCQWCADVVIPVRHTHIPVRPSKCPMCRKLVKQRFKIHMGT